MKKLIMTTLTLAITLTASLSYAKNDKSEITNGSTIGAVNTEITLSKADNSFEIARQMVADSQCFKADIAKYKTIFVGSFKEIITEKSAVLMSKNGSTLYKINSTEETGKGFGLSEVGAYQLTRCSDFQEINQ